MEEKIMKAARKVRIYTAIHCRQAGERYTLI